MVWLLPYVPFLILLVLLAPIFWPQDGIGDAFRFWYAGHVAAIGASPYDPNTWASAPATYGLLAGNIATACAPSAFAPECLWPYPPLTTLLLAPFGFLDVRSGLNAFAVFVVLLTTASVLLVGYWMRARAPATHALALCACVASHPFIYDIHAGHFEGFGVIGVVLLAIGLTARRVPPVVVGALLLSIKPHLYIGFAMIVLLFLLARRDWRAIGWTTAILAAVHVATLLLFPEALGAMLGSAGQLTGIGWATTWAFATGLGPSPLVGVVIVYSVATVMFVAAIRYAPTERREQVLAAGGAAIALTISPYLHPYDLLVLFPAVAIALALDELASRVASVILRLATAALFTVGTWVAILGTSLVPYLPGAIPVVVLGFLAAAVWAARESKPLIESATSAPGSAGSSRP